MGLLDATCQLLAETGANVDALLIDVGKVIGGVLLGVGGLAGLAKAKAARSKPFDRPSSTGDAKVRVMAVCEEALPVCGQRLGSLETRVTTGDVRFSSIEKKLSEIAEGQAAIKGLLEGMAQARREHS